MSSQTLTVEKDSFLNFAKAIKKINDTAIFVVKENKMSVLTCTPDNVTIFYGTARVEATNDLALNITSVAKLIKAIEQIRTDEPIVKFVINSNNLEYKSPQLRFKIHLLDNGIISQPSITIKKIIDLNFDTRFSATALKLSELCSLSVFNTESNKVYLSSRDGKVFADLTDKTADNTDSMEFEFADSTDFDECSMSVDFFRCLSYTTNSTITININNAPSVVAIDVINDNYSLKYITSPFTA